MKNFDFNGFDGSTPDRLTSPTVAPMAVPIIQPKIPGSSKLRELILVPVVPWNLNALTWFTTLEMQLEKEIKKPNRVP